MQNNLDIDTKKDVSDRSHLISHKREKISIDNNRDYHSEALEKYAHFLNWFTEYAQLQGGVSSFSRFLSAQTGISISTFTRIFNNTDAKTSIYFINEICKFLDVSMDEVFNLNPKPVSSSNFRYALISYISLTRKNPAQNSEYFPLPIDNCQNNSNLEPDSYKYLCGCIDREVNYVIDALKKLPANVSNEIKIDNILLPYRILLTRRDYTNPTNQIATAMSIRKEMLSFKRMCQHAPRIDTILTFCLVYDISLDYLVDNRFAFDEIKDACARNLMRKTSVLDYNVCGVLSKIAILEREGHENMSNGLISNSSVSNKKLKTCFDNELRKRNL